MLHPIMVTPTAQIVAGCLLTFALSGCCMQHQCRDCDLPAEQAEAEEVPAMPMGPEYPRFHPVPTRPVFAPEGDEAVPASAEPVASGKSASASPNWVFAPSMSESDLRKMAPTAILSGENERHASRPSIDR